jgi:hypothetical protein
MDKLFGAAALTVLGVGARSFYLRWKNSAQQRLQRRKLEVWEGEGGALPVGRKRTAAQISPRKRRRASPRTDAR